MKKLYRKRRMEIAKNLKSKLHNLENIEKLDLSAQFNKSDEFLGDLITIRAYLNIVLHKYGY